MSPQDGIRLAGLLVYTFGAFAFGSIVFYSLRDPIWRSWGRREPGDRHWRAHIPPFAMSLMSFVWFVVLVLRILKGLTLTAEDGLAQFLDIAFLMISLAYPPLIGHVSAAPDSRSTLNWAWKLPYRLLYLINGTMAVTFLLVVSGTITVPRAIFGPTLGLTLGIGFAVAGIYSGIVVARDKRLKSARTGQGQREGAKERSGRRALLLLYAYMFVLAILMTLANVFSLPIRTTLEIVTTSLPLLFIFVGVYFDDRFEFFDLFIKRGLSMLMTLVILTVWFATVLPWVLELQVAWARSWAGAVTLLPVALGLPWLHRQLAAWLDSVYLGRRYASVEAIKSFLAKVQGATTEPALVEAAERGLTEIFRAPTRIALDADVRHDETDFTPALRAPIKAPTGVAGRLLMGRRDNSVPWFSEDVSLIHSLADVFGFTLENMRLQQRRQEQEQRAQELSLKASQSELKALRAQIQPHFLFNALNAIAGLIHDDPDLADETVERLAEVFRYTLRRSESEWSRLEDELDFAEAYLAVERARFGSRLAVKIDVSAATRPLRIPTMLVQTLLENAVKHGIASLRGPARITIRATDDGDNAIVEVRDNGPGPGVAMEAPVHGRQRRGEGYGLRHVRERLAGHYGGRASLELFRDEASGETVARLRLPSQPVGGEATNGRASA